MVIPDYSKEFPEYSNLPLFLPGYGGHDGNSRDCRRSLLYLGRGYRGRVGIQGHVRGEHLDIPQFPGQQALPIEYHPQMASRRTGGEDGVPMGA